jgi:tungstate transport system substrate-binding protein
MKRFSISLLTLLVLATMVLSACQPATPVATEPPATEAPTVTEAPTYSTDPTLTINGAVTQELTLSEAGLRGMEVVKITAEHPKNGPGEYEGVRLNTLLDQAGVQDGAIKVILTASDGFSTEVPMADIKACTDCLVGFGDPGAFNMVMPGMSGKAWIKGIVQIEVVGPPANAALILATTTSTQDSGLLDVLIPLFEQQTGYIVQTVAVGSGAAIKMGEEGNADVLLVHAPSSEITLMDGGFGKERLLVMHNYFQVVCPPTDPVGLKSATTAIEAFQKMAAAKQLFVSRGDDSGTDKMEKSLWKAAGIDPKGQSWYIESGQGMGATLTMASEKSACTLTDKATFLFNMANLQLAVVFENDPSLINVYHVITVNPDKWSLVNYEGALAFANFMVSAETQAFIGEYGVAEFGQQLFIPDAGKTDAELGLP